MNRKRKILILGIVIFSVLLSTFSFYIYQVLKTPNILVEQDDQYFHIYPGSSYQQVIDSLLAHNLVNDPVSFGLLAKYMDYPQSIKSGRYQLQSDMTNLEALSLLRSGSQAPVNITFNNVRLKDELAEKLTTNIALKSEEFLALISDPDLIAKYGFDSLNILSMFIPNTYEVYWDISGNQLMERMYREYENFWNPQRKEKAANLGLSPPEVSVLASIVNAESQKPQELATIAGLYMNRLDRGMALQADPTLVYAVGDFSIQRVLNQHKEIESPYNTYKYTGLPPGPIRSPSIAAIDAVLDHEDHNYLYMCAKEDFSGYHRFASSLSEHLRNARVYQNALNKARLFR